MSDTLRLDQNDPTALLIDALQRSIPPEIADASTTQAAINIPEPTTDVAPQITTPSPAVNPANAAQTVTDAQASDVAGTPNIIDALAPVAPQISEPDGTLVAPSPDIATETFQPPAVPQTLANVLAPVGDSGQTLDSIQEPDEDRSLVGALKSAATVLGTDPVLQSQLATIATSLTAASPRSFGFQLGSALREQAEGQQFTLAKGAVLDRLAGREPEFDINTATLSPELIQSATVSALGEVQTALDLDKQLAAIPTEQAQQLNFASQQAKLQSTLAGIESPTERFQRFRMNEAQIAATTALEQQRTVETLQTIQGTPNITSANLSLIREIDSSANLAATNAAGIQGVTELADGTKTFKFKNPQLYLETYNTIRNSEITQAISNGVLPKSASTLLSGTPQPPVAGTGQARTAPLPSQLDTTRTESASAKRTIQQEAPNARFVGSQVSGDSIWYYYDTTGDGKGDQALQESLR